MISPKEIDDLFTYHNPAGIDPARFNKIRDAAKHLGLMIIENGGTERDIKLSIEHLRIAIHFAIASIVVP